MYLLIFVSGADSTVRARLRRMAAALVLIVPFLLAPSKAAERYQFESWEGAVPASAVEAGLDRDGQPVFICIASSWDGKHPGMLGADGVCQVAWGGQGHEFGDGFSVLTDPEGFGPDWVEMSDGGVPSNAFPAGTDGGPIFVCRVEVDGGYLVGKVTDDQWCFVGIDGEEKKFTENYEVLGE